MIYYKGSDKNQIIEEEDNDIEVILQEEDENNLNRKQFNEEDY